MMSLPLRALTAFWPASRDRKPPMKVILVAGSGRSGTTWLGNIIAGDEWRILFEPFNERRVPAVAGLGLRPYFHPTAAYPQWHPVIERVLRGHITNAWTDKDRPRLKVSQSAGLLIKEIRVNGMLAWLDHHFHPTIVYIIRHPCAVIASRLQLQWDTPLEAILAQPQLMRDYLAPYEPLVRGARSAVQKHAIMWCVENLIPLTQLAHHNWICCTYEHLVLDPGQEIRRLLAQLQLPYSEARAQAVEETSRTSWGRTAMEPQHLLGDWQTRLDARAKQEIAALLEAFAMTLYTVDDVLPHLPHTLDNQGHSPPLA
ncbi:MAG: hypothetical protein AB7N91_15355 [Candidatus Tectimicrobiota bacterium]